MPDLDSPTESVFQFDSLFQPAFGRAPQPYYRQMRDTNPVLQTPSLFGDGGVTYFVAKHADIEFALRNPELFSSQFAPAGMAAYQLIPENVDPPDHARYRRLLDPLFGPRQMEKLEQGITDRANELIDAFIDRGGCDYAAEYAVPLPCSVFLQLVGFPLEEMDAFLRLKEGILRGSGEMLISGDDPVRMEASAEASERFEALIADRRRSPRDDLLSHLVTARIEGQPLTREELLGICHLLLVAGLDTVTDSLTCFYAVLGRDPGLRRRIVDDPEVIPAAVEELLRYESPVPFVPRVAAGPAQLSGCPMGKGDQVVLLLGSANTDEAVHERAGEIDFDRQASRHYAFGGGIHRCLGSHLARIELRVSLREWHRRIPDYRIPDDVELEFSPMLRQVEHLPLVF